MSEILKQQLKAVAVGNLKRTHKKYQVWPLEKKIEVVTQYLILGNMRLVGAMTGVDYALIRQWKMQPWWSDLEKEIRATQNIEMDTKLSKIVEKSMAVTMDRLENGEMVLNNKTGQLVRKPVAMRDAAKVATDFMQRQQVIRKDESQTTQVSQVSVTEQLKTLAMEFAKWTEKKKLPIDVETIEIIEDADVPIQSDSDLQPLSPDE